MSTQTDSRQVKKRQALARLGTAASASLETILDQVNIEVDSPLRMAASATADARLNFSSSQVDASDSAKEVVSAVKKQVFASLSSPFINFQTQAVSNAADFDIVFPASTVGFFRHVGFTLIGSGKIKALFSAETATEGALSNPGALFVSGGLPIGYVTLVATAITPAFKTAGSATNIIENTKIFRFAGGGGGGSSSSASGSGGGGELVDLLFQAAIRDSFSDIPDGTTTIDIAAGKTDASLHDVANELLRLNYDASRTVTGTGTAMTISVAPSFTIKAGDMIVINSTGEARRISSISSQTVVTIESAFSVDPSAAACCISQAVHTVDLNAFDNAGLGLAASSQFSTNIDEILVGYSDSDTLGDVIPDFGTAADIAFSASADNTNWSTAKTRVDSLSSEDAAVSTPTASNQLRLRFFANKTSGTGAVNLLSYKVFFHKQTGETVGEQLLSAFARPTSSIAQNCTHSVSGGKSRFQFTWAFPRGNNDGEASGSALVVYANGQRIPRFTSGVTDNAQASFTELSDTLIEMDTDYSAAGIDFQFRVERTVIDSNTNNVTRISELEDVLSQAVDAQIVPTFLTAFNGSPSATQFRSDITGRKQIPDLAANLSPSFGSNRMMIQNAYQLPEELGPSGQRVFGILNDKFNQVRLVGSWIFNTSSNGVCVFTQTVGDFAEIVFYGTDLNVLVLSDGNTGDFRATVDGGAESANLYVLNSTVLSGRNYSKNTIVRAASGLSLGVHTVKLRVGASSVNGFILYGFEVLNTASATNLTIGSGVAVKGKNELILPALANPSFNSSFESGILGTRGGNVVVYLKEDGTIGKAVTPTNGSQGNLTSADHTNEEVIRRYGFREFGANRTADDIQTTDSSSSTRAFTMDDGTTTIVVAGFRTDFQSSPDEILRFANLSASDFINITFVGTGLDIIRRDEITGPVVGTGNALTIDGVSAGNLNSTFSRSIRREALVSGLPYGTHVLRISGSTTHLLGLLNIIVYGPKKPAIPATAIELSQYYVMADFSANATAGLGTIATGVLRKMCTREFTYSGTWSIGFSNTRISGFNVSTGTTTSYVEHVFYGTGFEFRFDCQAVAATVTATLNGSTNLSAFTTAIYGPNLAFNSATGVITASASNVVNSGLRVSGLSLGVHIIRFTLTSGTALGGCVFDVITPIHNPALNLPFSTQNVLNVGSDSLADLRQFNTKDISENKLAKVAQAKFVSTGITTTLTNETLMPDMLVPYYSDGEMVEINFATTVRNATAGEWTGGRLYLNGATINADLRAVSSSTINMQGVISDNQVVYLPKGFHVIEFRWRVSSGTGVDLGSRTLIVKKISGE